MSKSTAKRHRAAIEGHGLPKHRGMRDLVNAEWMRLFPEEDDRPVRRTVESEFSGNRVVQIEFMAALPVGAR